MNLTDLITLDEETYEVPESRIGSIAGVRSRIRELKDGDVTRSRKRALVQGLIDGNAPYDLDEMVSNGRGDDANINFREAEGLIAAATTPYYELDFGVPRAVNIQLRFGDNKQKWYEWSEIISDLYSETLWGWKGYKINKQLSHWQMVVFGHGPLIWPYKRGWHFQAKRDDSVWVADNAMCDLDLVDEMALPGHFQPTELFKLIEKQSKDSTTWDVELAKELIVKAVPQTIKDTYHDAWAQYQASLRRGDTQWQNKSARIYYTQYLVREFNGNVTLAIVPNATPDTSKPDEEDRFLFKKTGMFDSLHQIIVPFHFDVGPDAHWYSVKGLGPKIYDFCDASNRFRCTLMNGAMAGCGIPLQAQNANALQKIQQTPLVRASGITFIPPDWAVQQINMRGALDQPLAVLRELQTTMQSNTGTYRQRVSEENQEPTLGQAQLNVQQQATLTTGSYDRYYHYSDDMHEEIVRRMLDPNITKEDSGGQEALDFREQCLNEGVPEEALDMKHVYCVKAFRNVGYGSRQMQQMVGQQLLQLLPTMDEEGRRNALRMNGATLVGQSHVDALWKPFSQADVPNDHMWAASMENPMLRQPAPPPPVTPAQDPVTHFVTHFQDAIGHVQQVKGGQGDPVGLVTHLDNVGPHNQQHLQAMSGDPTRKDAYDHMVKMHMMLGKVADQVKQEVAKAQANQQPAQPQVDPAVVQSMLKMVADLKLKEAKQSADDVRKDKKLSADMHRKDLTTASGIYRKNAETAPNGNGGDMLQPPAQKISESMSYKDVPEDIKRQLEVQAGLIPSRLPPQPQQP